MHRGELLQKAAEKTKAAIFDMEETFAAFFLLFSFLTRHRTNPPWRVTRKN
jgi:hypothetical protein